MMIRTMIRILIRIMVRIMIRILIRIMIRVLCTPNRVFDTRCLCVYVCTGIVLRFIFIFCCVECDRGKRSINTSPPPPHTHALVLVLALALILALRQKRSSSDATWLAAHDRPQLVWGVCSSRGMIRYDMITVYISGK